MKDFIKYIVIVPLATFFSYYALVICAIYYMQTIDTRAPIDVTTALFGNSTGECAINDSILKNFKNYCSGGLNYDIEEEFIKAVLEKNPHIKTAVLCFDRFQYFNFPNTSVRKYKSSAYTHYSGFIAFERFNIFRKYSLYEIVKLTIGSNLLISPMKAHFGYYRLAQHGLPESIEKRNLTCPEIKDISYEHAKIESSYNIDALLRIINFCHQKDVKIVILSTPMYQLERWYGKSGYYEFLNTLDDSVQIADYSDFPMPSDDYYGDVIHLNYKGAEYFSKHLKEHGLKSMPVREYLRAMLNHSVQI